MLSDCGISWLSPLFWIGEDSLEGRGIDAGLYTFVVN